MDALDGLTGDRSSERLVASRTPETAKTRFQTYWEHTAECLFAVRVTENGTFVFEGLNPAHERVSGLTNVMIAGKAPHDCLPADIADAITAHYQDCVNAGEAIQYEEILDLPGGVKRWQTRLAPMRDPNTGRISLILGSAHDLTPIYRATEQAEHGRRLLERIAKACPDFIYVYDIGSRRFDFISSRVQAVLGHAPEHLHALRDQVVSALVHPDDFDRVSEHMHRLAGLPDNVVASVECRLMDAERLPRWFKTRDMVLGRAADGRAAKVIGVAIDISDLKATQTALYQSNRRLQSILAGVSDCYFALDRDLNITDVSDAALIWVGKSRAEVVGQPGLEVFRNSPLDQLDGRQAVLNGMPTRVEIPSAIHPGRWVEANYYASTEGVSCFFRDITDRKENEHAVESTKRLLESTINAMSAIVAILDEQGRIVMVNNAWRRFVTDPDGSSLADATGREYLSPSNLSPRRGQAPRFRAGLRSVLAGSADSYRQLYRTRADVGCWFRMTATRFQSDGWTRIVVVHEDTSDLQVALQSISQLSQKLNNIQEEERQRIACELHDSTSQHLTAVSLNMISLRHQLDQGGVAPSVLDEIEQSVDEAQKEIRVFSYLLHPPYLERDGLRATLSRFVDGFVHRTGLVTDARIAPDIDDISIALQRSVLRIVQEALANVHRHANATQATVNLTVQHDRLVLVVADNGKGIPASRQRYSGTARPRGMGLSGMQMRVRQFGGKLAIRTGPKGTWIRAQIPLSSDNDLSRT